MTNYRDYMDMAMREAEEERRQQRLYRKLHLSNIINRATMMEERGTHLEELTATTMKISIAEIASHMSTTTESRHRMAKEIAEELLAEKGDDAYFFCLEKLANNTAAPKLWRDVLSYLDEMKGESDDMGIGRDTNQP